MADQTKMSTADFLRHLAVAAPKQMHSALASEFERFDLSPSEAQIAAGRCVVKAAKKGAIPGAIAALVIGLVTKNGVAALLGGAAVGVVVGLQEVPECKGTWTRDVYDELQDLVHSK